MGTFTGNKNVFLFCNHHIGGHKHTLLTKQIIIRLVNTQLHRSVCCKPEHGRRPGIGNIDYPVAVYIQASGICQDSLSDHIHLTGRLMIPNNTGIPRIRHVQIFSVAKQICRICQPRIHQANAAGDIGILCTGPFPIYRNCIGICCILRCSNCHCHTDTHQQSQSCRKYSSFKHLGLLT